MAHTKTGAATKGNRDSKGKRLGIKVYGGTRVVPGNILVRQRGTKIHPGLGTKLSRDFSIYAVESGFVQFKKRLDNTIVEVLPIA